MQRKLIIEDYINDLASNKPTPGGGSAAALVGALGSALTSMVFNLTIGKKDYEALNDDEKQNINTALKEAEKYNNMLLEFMDKDGEAFLSLIKAFKLPNTNEEEKKKRREAIDLGYENALQVPLTLAKESLKFYSNIIIACKYGNKNVLSDAGVASILLYACIESSILNVKINLAGIKDEEYKQQIHNTCVEIVAEALGRKNKVEEMMNEYLK